MPTLKLTTWNVEYLERLVPGGDGQLSPRLSAIATEILEVDPDVLCLIEAPADLAALRAWVASADGLGGRYRVPDIPGTDAILDSNPANPRGALKNLYAMRGVSQWIWFLVRDELHQAADATLLDPRVWRDLTGQAKWAVHLWGEIAPEPHRHWRHPQTLLLSMDGFEMELIGVHLKSKINRESTFDADDQLKEGYVAKAYRARAFLATEANDIRRYIEGRFGQEPNPRIVVCGDMNDGPGKDYFERVFLYFDLISNMQGDVFFARRFLNHALFDFDDALRWSSSFRDKIEVWARLQPDALPVPEEPFDRINHQLLDHILFTQALVGEEARPRVKPQTGLVEHTIHQRINATLTQVNQTSDHVPVSVTFEY